MAEQPGASVELSGLLEAATAQLTEASIPSPRVDAELLAGHLLNASRGEVQTKVLTGAQLSEEQAERFNTLVAERAQRIPLQHLTGTAPFRTLELRVGPGAFIPRPETETVVEAALERLRQMRSAQMETAGVEPRLNAVDLGTGSGAIAAALAAEFPQAEIHAVELSEEAAAWAELNFQNLPSGSAPVRLHQCDLREFPEQVSEEFDVVVSNPPYIPEDMVPTEREVRDHDPELALYGGGRDGLEMPRAVIEAAKALLRPGGWFILEHAEVQAEALREICETDPSLTDVETHQDLSGRPRSTSAVVKEYSA